MTGGAPRPFEGIRVLDLTHVLAGPFCTYQLAVLGAETIKIEEPGQGDIARQTGCDRALNRRLMGTGYLTQGANKRCLTLDLKNPKGREILKRLVVGADVLVENFRSGAMARARSRLRGPPADQPAPHLLLDDRLRPGRPQGRAQRLRLRHPGHLGPDEHDGLAGNAAGEDGRAGHRLRERPERGLRGLVGAVPARAHGAGAARRLRDARRGDDAHELDASRPASGAACRRSPAGTISSTQG